MAGDEDGPGSTRPVVLVTGGSEGIGKALAVRFARDGHDLMLVARTLATLEATAAEIATAWEVKVEVLSADLSTLEGCAAVAVAIEAYGLHVDVLVNDAGVGLAGSFHKRSLLEHRSMLDLNVTGLTDLAHRFLPGMIARGRGGILNVASIGGMVPGPYQAAYYASKSYVISLTRALSVECFGTGVRISTLAPGPVATDFHATMGVTNALYLKTLHMQSPEQTAYWGYLGYKWGLTLVVPSLSGIFFAVVLKFMPHVIAAPVIGWLLKRRLN